jgi:hypothetical protein
LTTFPKIWCIWYPAGGFGHFVNGILTLYGHGFIRPNNKQFNFSDVGDSHALELVAPKYYHDPEEYKFLFDQEGLYSVLVDNGINNETKRFLDYFADSKVIKICYSDHSWPVIARTMIEKGMRVDFDQEVKISADAWPTTENWVLREKYFLFLRDNHLRSAWRADPTCDNLLLDDLVAYTKFKQQLVEFGITTEPFEELWQNWLETNKKYLEPCKIAQNILDSINLNEQYSLNHIVDVWTQAIVYYYIWLKYRFEVPHNDYANWFTNVEDISIMLNKHGVLVDSN